MQRFGHEKQTEAKYWTTNINRPLWFCWHCNSLFTFNWKFNHPWKVVLWPQLKSDNYTFHRTRERSRFYAFDFFWCLMIVWSQYVVYIDLYFKPFPLPHSLAEFVEAAFWNMELRLHSYFVQQIDIAKFIATWIDLRLRRNKTHKQSQILFLMVLKIHWVKIEPQAPLCKCSSSKFVESM